MESGVFPDLKLGTFDKLLLSVETKAQLWKRQLSVLRIKTFLVQHQVV